MNPEEVLRKIAPELAESTFFSHYYGIPVQVALEEMFKKGDFLLNDKIISSNGKNVPLLHNLKTLVEGIIEYPDLAEHVTSVRGAIRVFHQYALDHEKQDLLTYGMNAPTYTKFIEPGMSVLVMGIECPYTANEVLQFTPGCDVTFIDKDKEAINLLYGIHGQKLQLDATKEEIPSNYDLCICDQIFLDLTPNELFSKEKKQFMLNVQENCDLAVYVQENYVDSIEALWQTLQTNQIAAKEWGHTRQFTSRPTPEDFQGNYQNVINAPDSIYLVTGFANPN